MNDDLARGTRFIQSSQDQCGGEDTEADGDQLVGITIS